MAHPVSLPSIRLLRLVLVLGLVGATGTASAQSSIIELGTPEGPSSGEIMPEDLAPADLAPAVPPPCGNAPLTIARLQWPSAALLAQVHALILERAYGCEVQLLDGDLATVASAMGAGGQPAIAPEMWSARVPEIWNAAVKAQQVRQAGASYGEQVFEGWFVPDYAVERWPDITTIDGLAARAVEMGQGRDKPRFITCPLDWACSVINRNLLAAHGLTDGFEVVAPANRFELDTLIAEAVGRSEPFVFYYWQPNAILAQFAFREVALGSYNKDNLACLARNACTSPQPSGFPPEVVVVAVGEKVYTDAPRVASYFQRARMPFAEMNRMLLQLGETGATVETVAEGFVAAHEDVWQAWVGSP